MATNSEDGEIVRGLLYELLDHYLGLPQDQWPEKWHAFKIDRLNQAAKQVQAAEAKPAKVGPSLSLDRYVGDYSDPWYGTIKVRQSGTGLAIDFPHSSGMEGPLTTINTIRSRRTRSSTGSSPPMSASRSTRTGRSTG